MKQPKLPRKLKKQIKNVERITTPPSVSESKNSFELSLTIQWIEGARVKKGIRPTRHAIKLISKLKTEQIKSQKKLVDDMFAKEFAEVLAINPSDKQDCLTVRNYAIESAKEIKLKYPTYYPMSPQSPTSPENK